MQLDHLAVVCDDLDVGTAAVEAALGVTLEPGGEHALFGTHNRLLSLGPGLYLEVISPNPAAPTPGRARWFDLDLAPSTPRLGNWIARVPDIMQAVAAAPDGVGDILSLVRAALQWRLSVPRDGSLPMQAGYPTLIQWDTDDHPAQKLPDRDIRLKTLCVAHPQAAWLTEHLAGAFDDARIEFVAAATPALSAVFETPNGLRTI